MYYKTTDLAVIIPTRNRPFQVKLHLQSLVEQDCEIGKVIVVASGKDIKDIITQFENKVYMQFFGFYLFLLAYGITPNVLYQYLYLFDNQ